MLKVKHATKDTPPVKHIENIRGVDITLYIRPLTPEIADEFNKEFTRGFEWVPDAAGRKVKQPTIDKDALFDAQLDYMLAGWEKDAIGDEDGTPWPVDLEHKKRFITLIDDPHRAPISERIINASTALAFDIAGAKEDERKNSLAG